jgi:integrase
MPLKLIPPRPEKSPNWTIRGTHLKVYVDKSSGTPRRSLARQIRDKLERAIEAGEYPTREVPPRVDRPTFLSAAVSYLEAGKRRRYVAKLIKHFGETPIEEVDQAAIDKAALTVCRPGTGPGGRNAAVYTPVSAILHHAGVEMKIKRPKGAKGREVTDWLTPEDASMIITAAAGFDIEFSLFLKTLVYTGLRPSEPLSWQREDLRLAESDAWTRRKKGGIASNVKLRDDLRDALGRHMATHERRRVFRFHQGGHLKHILTRAKLAGLGLPCPARRPTGWRQPPNRLTWVNFKTFRHTWATWMRIYGGLDGIGLRATDNWRDLRSVARYSHAVPRDEWTKVEKLPAIAGRK